MIDIRIKLFIVIFTFHMLPGVVAHVGKRCHPLGVSPKFKSVGGNEYNCPGDNDPISFTECCDNGACCERKNLLFQFDDDLIMIVGVTVITVCITIMTVVVICCFWSKCPCYTKCRSNYTSSETIVYSLSKDNPVILVPNEKDCSQYTPCLVKIKRVEEY